MDTEKIQILKDKHSKLNKNTLTQALRNEHPQVIALYLILVQDYDFFAEFLDAIPKRLQTDIGLRAAAMDYVNEYSLDIFLKTIGSIGESDIYDPEPDRVKLYNILKSRPYIIDGIDEIDPDLAYEIAGDDYEKIKEMAEENSRLKLENRKSIIAEKSLSRENNLLKAKLAKYESENEENETT